MRLSKQEQKIIKKVFLQVFQKGEIYLFGSRTNDNVKGGDIDLYLKIKDLNDSFQKKILFLTELKIALGDQKIDVIISKDTSRLIEQEAIKNGILL